MGLSDIKFMDNRLTKRRLSDFLAYEWIIALVVIAAAILVMELIYTTTAARLSTGQLFKYYFDEELYSYEQSDKSVYQLLGVNSGENGKTFSYEILSVDYEMLNSSYNVLSIRLSVQEGDAIFTSAIAEEGKSVKAKQIIDVNPMYDMQTLLNGAKTYLTQFIVDGGDIYNSDDYDDAKIRSYFDNRMKSDNRFRSENEKEEGRINEIGRIKKLATETKDFEKLLSVGEEKGLFYRYTKYEQTAASSEDENYKKSYENEKSNGRENLIYGFNMYALKGEGKKNVSDYMKISGKDNADGVVLLLFDFSKYQYDLQFESISFVNTLVREFSDFLD